MSRSSKNKIRKSTPRSKRILLSALTAATLSVGVLPVTTHAAGYSFQQHTVNAGVLVNGTDPAPYLFYVFNNRPDVKPTDITLVNPLAPSTAQPNTAAYWEVALNSISDSQMAQYNVLYLPAGIQTFSPALNEKLRRFVDNGGQLIIEYGTAVSPSVPGLFTGTGPGTGASSTAGPPPIISSPASLRHPIISQPYLLSGQDLTDLGTVTNYVGTNTLDSIRTGEYNNTFAPALVGTGGTIIAATQIGAGQVIVSSLNLGPLINAAATVSPVNFYLAPTSDLKILANIIAWSEAHPNEGKSSHGNASNTGLPSFSQAWQFPPNSVGTIAPSAATVWGNFVFAVDATGILHAFDAYPSENLTGTANTTGPQVGAEQITAGLSKYPQTSYDEVWQQSGFARASSPTLAAFGGVHYVFVEKNDGSVVYFNAVTGAAGPLTLTPPAAGGPFTGAAPAPTYYDGRIYAGQANGTLHVYDLNESGTGVAVPLSPNTIPGESVTAAPSVGTLANLDSNAIVAVVSTNYNVYSVLLGARNEPLKSVNTNGALSGYSINRQGRYHLPNIFADLNAVPSLRAYDSNGVVQSVTANATAPNPQDPLFSITSDNGFYTDWDMDFASAVGTGTPATPVDLNYISGSSFGASAPSAATISAPAIDRHGDYYYTETNVNSNSYVVGVKNATLFTNVLLKFRFLMPNSSSTTALSNDGVTYSNLLNYKFVGAPVVDDQDNVYVVATNGALATVLCFRGDQQISATSTSLDLTTAMLSQPDESGGGQTNTFQRGPDANLGTVAPTYGQYIASTDSVSFYNSGKRQTVVPGIAGNLTEPQQITATPTDGTGQPTQLNLRTNLAWYVTPFSVSGTSPITGLSLVGSGLLMTDGTTLYKLSTTPLVGSGREVAATLTEPSETPISAGTNGVGLVGAPPSVGGNVMVVNGTNGIAALTRQITVIADSNRILGVDGGGSAVWAVDATTRVGTDGTTAISTRVPFSHPTALSQFALNDYLVADTGNNRCVRFDNGGNVRWELTRFQDPQGLMGTGQPLTLSQPSSVETRQATISTASTLYPGDAATYYLIADSGNDRLVEVADFVNPTNGNLDGNHVLTWVSHTADRDNRHYRYGSAAYYPNPTNLPSGLSIAATVTNLRLAPLAAAGQLGPASGDAPGGSIVVFNYPASVQPYNASAPSDLAFTTAGYYVAATNGGSTTYQPLTIRNPRFLQLYTPITTGATSPVTTVSPFDFLYADDNGVFDLSYNTTKNAFVAGADRLQFSQFAYDNMTYQTTGTTPVTVNVPAFGVPGNVDRTKFPFIPTCVQALGTYSVSNGTITTRRYLITQNYSQGELGTVNTTTTGTVTTTTGKLGGEIFEVDVTANSTTGAVTVTTPGGFGDNQTLSHPDLTGPLTQPTFGVRLP